MVERSRCGGWNRRSLRDAAVIGRLDGTYQLASGIGAITSLFGTDKQWALAMDLRPCIAGLQEWPDARPLPDRFGWLCAPVPGKPAHGFDPHNHIGLPADPGAIEATAQVLCVTATAATTGVVAPGTAWGGRHWDKLPGLPAAQKKPGPPPFDSSFFTIPKAQLTAAGIGVETVRLEAGDTLVWKGSLVHAQPKHTEAEARCVFYTKFAAGRPDRNIFNGEETPEWFKGARKFGGHDFPGFKAAVVDSFQSTP